MVMELMLFIILLGRNCTYVYYINMFLLAPSGPPEGISAVALGPRKIQINWNQPLPEEQNGIIRSYLVNVTVAETGQRIELTTNSTNITATNLHPFYHYHYSVAAVTVALGPYTEIHILQTPQDGKQMSLEYKFTYVLYGLMTLILLCFCI